ncbi:MAG: TraC family protein [bacterium]
MVILAILILAVFAIFLISKTGAWDKIKSFLGLSELDAIKAEEFSRFFEKLPLSKYLFVRTYDKENGIYIIEDPLSKPDYLGFGFLVYPKTILSADTLRFLETGIYQNMSVPEDTILQWNLWGGDFIDPAVEDYVGRKEKDMQEIAAEYKKFLEEHKNKGFTLDWQSPVRDVTAFLTVKIPFNLTNDDFKNESQVNAAVSLKNQINSTLNQANLMPEPLDPETLIFYYRMFFNPNHNARDPFIYDENELIKRQAILRDTLITQPHRGKYIKVDDYYGRALTVKTFPQEVTSFDIVDFLGSTEHLNRNQINTKFFYSFIVRKVSDTEKNSLSGKLELTMKQKSFSSLSRKLRDRQEDASVYSKESESGQQTWKGFPVWYLYDKDYKVLDDAVSTVKNTVAQKGFELQEELVVTPFFLASTPFNASKILTEHAPRRAYTMLSYNAANLTPLQSDWKGSGTPTIPLISRRGQLMFIDLWDTNGGMNASLAGPMGQGKSFFVNHIIFNYRTMPKTILRIIDVGASYLGIAELFGGEFIEPSFDKPICVNPFSNVVNLNQEISQLVGIVDRMIKPSSACTDTERGLIQLAIRNCFEKYGNDTNITFIRDEILQISKDTDDAEFKKLADYNLLPWAKGGQYEKFFDGKSEIDFTNRLIVFELGKIKEDTALTNILLMTIFHHINKEIYYGDRSDRTIKKIVIWDEAWRFTSNNLVLPFIEMGSREYRKFGASLIFITQSIADFQKNDTTKTIKRNSEYLFIFYQQPEEWERIAKDDELYISEYEKNIYRDTLHTVKGAYSEILVISSRGKGIGRLLMPPELYWLYTTDSAEVGIRQKFIDECGGNMSAAVQKCIEWKKTHK